MELCSRSLSSEVDRCLFAVRFGTVNTILWNSSFDISKLEKIAGPVLTDICNNLPEQGGGIFGEGARGRREEEREEEGERTSVLPASQAPVFLGNKVTPVQGIFVKT